MHETNTGTLSRKLRGNRDINNNRNNNNNSSSSNNNNDNNNNNNNSSDNEDVDDISWCQLTPVQQ